MTNRQENRKSDFEAAERLAAINGETAIARAGGSSAVCPPASPARLNERLESLYNEVDIVKMNCMRRIAEELNRKAGETEKDVQKESQTVLKSVEIQARLLAERRRNDDTEIEPALDDIWQAIINLPEAGSILRRDSVRARLVEALRQRLL